MKVSEHLKQNNWLPIIVGGLVWLAFFWFVQKPMQEELDNTKEQNEALTTTATMIASDFYDFRDEIKTTKKEKWNNGKNIIEY